MEIETKRLLLRKWRESDADSLFKYASCPDIGPIAGWQPHKSVTESLDVIKKVLCGGECYAICLKENNIAVGCIELKLTSSVASVTAFSDGECELGYWIGKPFWGQGLVPEAAEALIQYAFDKLGMTKIWCGYYDGNLKSKRVQEKLGFHCQWTKKDAAVPLMNETRVCHVSSLTKKEWTKKALSSL